MTKNKGGRRVAPRPSLHPYGRHINQDGYVCVYIEHGKGRIPKREHRLIWEKENGPIPKGYHIDHIDGDRSNNEINNLRLATNQENSRHHIIKPMSNITKRGNSYRVRLCVDSKHVYFGSYPSLIEAQNKRDQMRKKLFGEFMGTYNGAS